ncbi:MAG: electron transport complex subunit RsxC [Candidatus Margulisiibacteriota bacterium]|nr:MAG: electron transport complex subunit RsxC [Candidatus Margulisiibacteriota bacterium]HCY36302.1 electron transport complex subunit RsxC [Candidatus Margulisiibacteriota bacterium]
MKQILKTFKGGIKLPHHKHTSEMSTVTMPIPKKVVIPMLQHIGAPCAVLVKKGDKVKVGQKIGDSESFISAPVHSSVSGVVLNVKPVLYPGGFEVPSVEIEPDGLQEVYEGIMPPGNIPTKELISAIRESGIVGLGGAGFPTSVKLSPPPGKTLAVLIINGAECEPYITSDYREMMENPQGIIDGTRIIMDIAGIKKAFIAIESNKPEAIKLLTRLLRDDPDIKVASLRTVYPQGAEKQMIYTVSGREVPGGKLPADVGVLVQNINTASFIAGFIKTGMPLIKKRVTIAGSAVKEPKNVEVLIGTPLKDVFEFCGGFAQEPLKIIMGGPMMGIAQFSLDNMVVKHTNALLAFNRIDAELLKESACIRCGKCATVCPMGLLPLYINANMTKGLIEDTVKYSPADCIECGSCSYVCPAKRHLVQSIRYVKAELQKLAKKK